MLSKGVELIETLLKLLDSWNGPYARHSERTSRYAVDIGTELELPLDERSDLYIGGLLHDIGKLSVPEYILNKPSSLDPEEFELIKQHPAKGYELASRFPEFGEGVLNIILHHHERFDGTGYPCGLKGQEIPLSARIIAVADSFDAMISERVYRKQPHDRKYAANQLIEGRGTQFDPVIVDIFLELLTSLEPPCNTNYSQSCKGGMNDV
ncbi:Cyclic di-GMP phosphodiesterase response regulator RpfG [compost metagenome]